MIGEFLIGLLLVMLILVVISLNSDAKRLFAESHRQFNAAKSLHLECQATLDEAFAIKEALILERDALLEAKRKQVTENKWTQDQ
jgi:hypothetical protein